MRGQLRVIIGPMFAGKSTELLRLVDRHKRAFKSIGIVKPQIDDRYSCDEVVTHNGSTMPSVVVEFPFQIADIASSVDVIAVDEAQFFEPTLYSIIDSMLEEGKTAIVAGLDFDYKAEPFSTMVPLILYADHLHRLTAVCDKCGDDNARRSQRIVSGSEQVQVGGKESYEARCNNCYVPESIYSGSDKTIML